MARLILHIGPGKCGSSSIQHFFASYKRPCVQRTRYVLLDPADLKQLDEDVPDASIATDFSQQLISYVAGSDVVILSHEYLFQAPYAVRNICRIAVDQVTAIAIVGYSRRQSSFLVSAYSQWLFRSPQRVQEVLSVIEDLSLSPLAFTGLERQIIASTATDFVSARQLSGQNILNWQASYSAISQLTGEYGAITKCGVLPTRASGISLIQDFCEKAELTLRPGVKNAPDKVSNQRFNPDVVEAINSAIALNLSMPGPHESNRLISVLSSQLLSSSTALDNAQSNQHASPFLTQLKQYVDAYFLSDNQKLCQQYGLDEAYFSVTERLSKAEILEAIASEARSRFANPTTLIQDYRSLSAKLIDLCLQLAESSSHSSSLSE